MSSPVLSAREVRVRTAGPGSPVVGPLSFDVAPGERIAIVGPSGSGKTTALLALCLLRPLQGGEILWNGAPVADADVPRFRSRVAYLAQRPAFVGATVEDDLRRPFLLGANRSRSFRRDRVVGWLRAAERPEAFLSKTVTGLSGGEAQLVALLRALQLEPEVLCLDESASAMDASLRQATEALTLLELGRLGAASVWISHDAALPRRLGARVIEVGTVPA